MRKPKKGKWLLEYLELIEKALPADGSHVDQETLETAIHALQILKEIAAKFAALAPNGNRGPVPFAAGSDTSHEAAVKILKSHLSKKGLILGLLYDRKEEGMTDIEILYELRKIDPGKYQLSAALGGTTSSRNSLQEDGFVAQVAGKTRPSLEAPFMEVAVWAITEEGIKAYEDAKSREDEE